MGYINAQQHKKDADRKRRIIQEHKKKPCMDCRVEYPPYVMDFDHRDGEKKELLVSKVGQHGLKRLLNEINKCDVVCSNCHRIRTEKRRMAKLVNATTSKVV